MIYFGEIVRRYTGWCPNAPVIHKVHPVLVTPAATVLEQPDGGAGGPAGISRGIRFAIEGIKVLKRNRSLLWFPLLTGLVAGIVFSIQYGVGLLAVYPHNAIDLPRWLVLTFCIALFMIFCCNVLMTGLFLSLSPGEGRAVSFREGLSHAKSRLRPLADWSVILALWCTALFAVLSYIGFSRFSLYPVAQLFPFRFILLPEVYHIGPIGGTYAMLYALSSSVAMAAIILFLTVISVFVVPLLVLENRSLPAAVAGSFALLKNTLAETIAIFLGIGAVLFAVSLLSLVFRPVYGIVAPDMQLFWNPGTGWVVAAGLFMLGVCALAFIGSAIAGIAAFSLYRYVKTSRVPMTIKEDQKAGLA